MPGQVTSGFLSRHLGDRRDLNEQNHGIGYISPEGYMLGAYMNSLGKPSVYAAREMLTDALRVGPARIRGGLIAGGVTGYGRPLQLLAMPEVVGEMDGHSLALGLVPPSKVAPATLALQYRRKF